MLSDNVKKWIKYSKNDLDLSIDEMNRNVISKHKRYEAILYHCQQSAEKVLKAYIIHNGSTQWGHDLETIRAKCALYDVSFNGERIRGHCNYLTHFIAARYPDFRMSVDASNATRAINSAKRIFDFTIKKIGLNPVYFR